MQPDDILKFFNIWTYCLVKFLSRKADFTLMDWYFHTYENEKWADVTDGMMWIIFYLVVIILYGAVAQPG